MSTAQSSQASFSLQRASSGDYWNRLLQSRQLHRDLFQATDNQQSWRDIFSTYVSVVNLEIFSYCNRVCDYCPVAQSDRRGANKFMDDAVFEAVIAGLSSIGYAGKILFNLYNEPLADEIIFSRIAQARKALPAAGLMFNSNGDYLDCETLDRLVECGTSSIFITLHTQPGKAYDDEDRKLAFRKFFDRIKRPLTLDRIVPGRSMATSFQHRGMGVEVFSNNHGVFGNSRAGAIAALNPDQARWWPCLRPFRELTIHHDGHVYPCCNFFGDTDTERAHSVGIIAQPGDIFRLFSHEIMAGYRAHLFTVGPKGGACGICSEGCDGKDQDWNAPLRQAIETGLQALPEGVVLDITTLKTSE